MIRFNLPDLGEGLQEAEIVRWHVAVGDKVAVDQPMVAVETAKAVVEVPAPQAGTADPGPAPKVTLTNESVAGTVWAVAFLPGDQIVTGMDDGQVRIWDEKTGTVRWTTEGREGEHASLLLTPQHVIFLTNGADLIVAKRDTSSFAVERRYEVAEASTFATPVNFPMEREERPASTSMVSWSPGTTGRLKRAPSMPTK